MKYNLCIYFMLMLNTKSITSNTYIHYLQDPSLINGLLRSKCLARDEKNCMEFCLNLPTLDGTYNSTSVSLKQMSNLQAHCNLKVEHDIEIVDLGEAVCYQVFLGQTLEYPDLVLIYTIMDNKLNNEKQHNRKYASKKKKQNQPSSSKRTVQFSTLLNGKEGSDSLESSSSDSSDESNHIVYVSDKNSSWHINNVHSGNNYLQEMDWAYIENMHILQKKHGSEGKIVLYKAGRIQKVYMYANRVYYEQGPVNISVLIPQIHPATLAAWAEIEDRAKIISDNLTADYYTTLDSFMWKKTKNRGKVLHLLVKQIINEQKDVAIMFIVPNNDPLAYIKETNPLCLSYCEELGWGPFSNYAVSCCSVIKVPELETYMMSRRIFPKMKSIMVYSKSQITGKKKVTMLNKMRMASKKYFCTNKNNEISVNNMRFLILEEVNNAEIKCTYPVLDNVLQLEDGSLIRGIIIKFSKKKKEGSNEPKNLVVTYSEKKDWDFYKAKQIFNNPEYWFVKLSETVEMPNLIGHIYKALTKESNKMDTNGLTSFGAYTCNLYRGDVPNISTIYSKENVIKKFRMLIKYSEKKQMTKFLKFLWDYRHIKLTSVMSHKHMMFTGNEFYLPCANIIMWKEIYEKYRTLVEKTIDRIISKVHKKDKDKFVYTFQYETLIFEKSKVKFNLDIDQSSRTEFDVPRYIISVIITKDKQIAFVTTNDVFLILREETSPFSITNTFEEYCNENQCTEYGYSELVDNTQINSCCRITEKFVETFMKLPGKESKGLKTLRDLMSKNHKVLKNPKS